MKDETMFPMEYDPENNTFGFGPLPEKFFTDYRLEVIDADPDFIYEIDLDRVSSPLALLNWIHHLSQKHWITTFHVGELIDEICRIKGWDHHGSN